MSLTRSTIDVGSNQALKPLVKLIPNLLAVSRAPSTLKGYHAHFQKWKAWAARFPQVIFFPTLELHVALYLISLIQSGYSFTTISLAYYSISFFHKSCAVRNPCDSSFVKAVLEGCKRFSAKSVSTTKRLPILPEHLHALVDKFAGSDAVFVLLLLLVSCALTSFVILNGVILFSRIRILLSISLGVRPISTGLVLPGWLLELAILLALSICYVGTLK